MKQSIAASTIILAFPGSISLAARASPEKLRVWKSSSLRCQPRKRIPDGDTFTNCRKSIMAMKICCPLDTITLHTGPIGCRAWQKWKPRYSPTPVAMAMGSIQSLMNCRHRFISVVQNK